MILKISHIKIITLSIVLSAVIFMFSPTITMAGGSPTISPVEAPISGANLGTNAATTANQVLKTLKDYGLDQVAYVIAQKIGQKMATLAINKATGGADSEKDPNFVEDFGQLLNQIEESERSLLSSKLLLSNNPFARQAGIDMMNPKKDPLPSFSLGNLVQGNVVWGDVAGDLSLAGSSGLTFYSQTALPQNTPMGSSVLTQQQLAQNINNKKQSNQLKLTGSGFLPQSECNYKVSDYVNTINETVGMNQEQIFDDPKQAAAYAEAAAKKTNANMQGLTEDTMGCIEEMIKNPVETTAKITTEAGKFGMDMTKNISGWGQIVAGVFISLFNGFMNEGLSTLKADYGQMRSSNTGGPEQINASTTGQTTSNFANAPFNIVDLKTDFEPALQATRKSIETLTSAQQYLLVTPARLAVLDMCIPGPDKIKLEQRLDNYYSKQTDWLQKNSIMGSDDKRNAYQEELLKKLEQDYSVAKIQMLQEMLDDTKNIPGVAVMRSAVDQFETRRRSYKNITESLTKAIDTETKLQNIITELRKNLIWLKSNVTELANLPELVFTTDEWDALPPSVKNDSYTWAVNQMQGSGTPIPQVSDTEMRDYVIKTTWRLWEYPNQFMTDDKWPDAVTNPETLTTTSPLAESFLMEKNKIRSVYSSLKGNIPSDWEIEQASQQRDSFRLFLGQVDNLIYDCNKMRELIWGTNNNGYLTSTYTNKQDMLADLLAKKEIYFKSPDYKNALSLPNFFTRNTSWQDDGCYPKAQVGISANQSSAITAEFSSGPLYYGCLGTFGHINDPAEDVVNQDNQGFKFSTWIDSASNLYLASSHITWPTELYWRSRILIIAPLGDADGDGIPDENTYNPMFGNAWSVTEIDDTENGDEAWDGGKQRKLFCRLSSIHKAYSFGQRSGFIIDRKPKAILCSSKWADVSISEAIGSFITDSIF